MLTSGPDAVAPVATAGAVSAVTSAWDAQRQRDGLVAEDTLKEAIEVVNGMGIKLRAVHTHALPASGGASGIGATIAEYATSRGVDVAVVGSRGLGAFKRSLMSVVGLGSVSDYCTHHLHCPVLVVRQGCLETLSVAQPDPEHPSADKRKIAVALDNSSHSMAMFEWALNNLIRETDILHVISVASNVNMHVPLMEGASPQLTAAEVDAWKVSWRT